MGSIYLIELLRGLNELIKANHFKTVWHVTNTILIATVVIIMCLTVTCHFLEEYAHLTLLCARLCDKWSSKCKGPEVGGSLVCWDKEEASMSLLNLGQWEKMSLERWAVAKPWRLLYLVRN